jgi:hypothetical protein
MNIYTYMHGDVDRAYTRKLALPELNAMCPPTLDRIGDRIWET